MFFFPESWKNGPPKNPRNIWELPGRLGGSICRLLQTVFVFLSHPPICSVYRGFYGLPLCFCPFQMSLVSFKKFFFSLCQPTFVFPYYFHAQNLQNSPPYLDVLWFCALRAVPLTLQCHSGFWVLLGILQIAKEKGGGGQTTQTNALSTKKVKHKVKGQCKKL